MPILIGILIAVVAVAAVYSYLEDDFSILFLGVLFAAFVLFIGWAINHSVEEINDARAKRTTSAQKVGLELVEESEEHDDLWIAKKDERYCLVQYIEAKSTFDVFVCEPEGN